MSNIAAVIDLETTGVDTATCEVVQCAVRLVSLPGCARLHGSRDWLARPLGPIPPGATAVHGITAENVRDAPAFADLVPEVTDELDCSGATDLVITFNGGSFDLPVLARYGLHVQYPHLDAYRVWQVARERKLPNDLGHLASRYTGALGSAYVWATGQEPDVQEHDAGADCEMTAAVAAELIARFGLPDCLAWSAGPLPGFADFDSKIRIVNGVHVLAFGKHAGTCLLDVPRSYLTWMARGDFHAGTKAIVRRYLG